MSEHTMMEEKAQRAGQGHIFAHYAELNAVAKAELDHFAFQTDFSRLNTILDASLALLHGGDESRSVVPPPKDVIFDVEKEKQRGPAMPGPSPGRLAAYERVGLQLIAEGKAAVVLLAGGSGTRLGVSYPKGFFTCGHQDAKEPLLQQHDKSLFQFHCERLRKAESLAHSTAAGKARGRIQLAVMTSVDNFHEIQQFFVDHGFFGLAKEQTHFFAQTSLPVYDAQRHDGDCDADGRPTHRILMASEAAPLEAPGGNGGLYESLASPRVDAVTGSPDQPSLLDVLAANATEFVQIFSVDNLLAKVGDPLFFGFSKARGCHVTVKTTPRASPEERVGVFAKLDGQWGVVEYTELGTERASLRHGGVTASTSDPAAAAAGELVFNCANIASHCCSLPFLQFAARQAREEVVYHAALKKVKVDKGTRECTGVKLEAFIFDMFRHCNEAEVDAYGTVGCDNPCDRIGSEKEADAAEEPTRDRFGILQVDRGSEFAPIKNATETAATDNPHTAAHLYTALTTRWVRELLERVLLWMESSSGDDDGGSEARRQASLFGPTSEGPAFDVSSEALSTILLSPESKLKVKEALTSLPDPSASTSSTLVPSAASGVYVEVAPLVSYAGEGLLPYLPYLLSAIPNASEEAGMGKRAVVLLNETVTPDGHV